MTGVAWADVLIGALVSLVSLTLLTFIFANPLAASLLPKEPPSGLRLLAGWFLGVMVQFVGWRLLQGGKYIHASEGVVSASLLAGFLWLVIILLAWWAFG